MPARSAKKSRRALLVANRAAQSGRNEERIASARRLLERAGLRHDLLATQPRGKTVAAVTRALCAKGYSLAIAMGGDGTISEVARGLLAAGKARQIPLGLLPTGTANDIGRSFGLESREEALERNVDVLAEGVERDLDAARLCALDDHGALLRESCFVDSAGWGFGPRILRTRNQDRRLVEQIPFVRELFRDELIYVTSAIKALGESYLEDTKFDVEAIADGKRHVWKGVSDLVVKGPRVYAGLWVLDPASKPDDGAFEVMPFIGRRDWLSKALLYLDHSGDLSTELKEIGLRHAEPIRGTHIELVLSPHGWSTRIPAQVDGEEFPDAPRVTIDVLARALRLIVPSRSADQ